MNDSAKSYVRLWFLLIAIGVIYRLGAYGYFLIHYPLHTDETLPLLQAKEISGFDLQLFLMGQPYQFPLESYLHVPWVHLLPHSTFGARILTPLLFVFSFMVSCLSFKQAGCVRSLGMVLLAFPSPYLLQLCLGIIFPGYAISFVLWTMATHLLIRAMHVSGQSHWVSVAVAGCLLSLSTSTNLVSLPVSFSLALMMFLSGFSRKEKLAYFLGALTGIIPLLVQIFSFPSARGTLFTLNDPLKIFVRMVYTTTEHIFPGLLGFNPPLVPDSRVTLMNEHVNILFMATVSGLLFYLVYRKSRFSTSPEKDRSPALFLKTCALIIMITNVILYALHQKSDSHTYRFFLPTLFALPWFFSTFRFGIVSLRFKQFLALGLAAMYLHTFMRLHDHISSPRFRNEILNTPDIQGVIRHLETHHIGRVFSSYKNAYRIHYLTRGKILASQAYNERFFHWPLPFYPNLINSSSSFAFVLTPHSRYLTPSLFERHLSEALIECRQEKVDEYVIYSDFNYVFKRPVNVSGIARLNSSSPGTFEGINQPGRLDIKFREPFMFRGIMIDNYPLSKQHLPQIQFEPVVSGISLPKMTLNKVSSHFLILNKDHVPVYSTHPRFVYQIESSLMIHSLKIVLPLSGKDSEQVDAESLWHHIFVY